MIEVVRQFALEMLAEAGERESARTRHLNYFVAWAEQRASLVEGPQQGEWLDQVEQEHENMLLALDFTGTNGSADVALDLVNHLDRTGTCAASMAWAASGLLRRFNYSEVGPVARAKALAAMGDLAGKQGAVAESRRAFEESLTLARECHDTHCIIFALYGLGWLSRYSDPTAAQTYFNDGLRLAREEGQVGQIGLGLSNCAVLALERGDLADAQTLLDETLAIVRIEADPWNVALTLIHMTELALRSGVLQKARQDLREGLGLVRTHKLRAIAARTLLRSSELAVAMSDERLAVRWSAAAAALLSAMVSKPQLERARTSHEAIISRVRQTTGAEQLAQATAEGHALDYEEALAEAQAWLEDPTRWAGISASTPCDDEYAAVNSLRSILRNKVCLLLVDGRQHRA